MPKSLQWCVTSLSVSSKVPSSSRNSIRSRADILPSLCWRSRRFSPPPASASWLRFFSSAAFSSRFICGRIIAGGTGRYVRHPSAKIMLEGKPSDRMKLKLPEGSFRAYLFDCDGTVADSMPLHYLAWKKALGEWNCDCEEEIFYAWGGMPVAEIINALNEKHGLRMPTETVARRKENLYF